MVNESSKVEDDAASGKYGTYKGLACYGRALDE